MEILLDKRFELLTVVQTLCAYWDNLSMQCTGKKLFSCKYKNTIAEYFGPFKNHETLKLYNHVSNAVMDISAFLKLALCYSDPPELKTSAQYEDNFGAIPNAIFPYKAFIAALQQFYRDTGFEQFYTNNKPEYDKLLTDYGHETAHYIGQFDISGKTVSKVFVDTLYTGIETIIKEHKLQREEANKKLMEYVIEKVQAHLRLRRPPNQAILGKEPPAARFLSMPSVHPLPAAGGGMPFRKIPRCKNP